MTVFDRYEMPIEMRVRGFMPIDELEKMFTDSGYKFTLLPSSKETRTEKLIDYSRYQDRTTAIIAHGPAVTDKHPTEATILTLRAWECEEDAIENDEIYSKTHPFGYRIYATDIEWEPMSVVEFEDLHRGKGKTVIGRYFKLTSENASISGAMELHNTVGRVGEDLHGRLFLIFRASDVETLADMAHKLQNILLKKAMPVSFIDLWTFNTKSVFVTKQ